MGIEDGRVERDGRCAPNGVSKRAYKRRRDARRALRGAQTAGNAGMVVYRCPHCSCFHLGHLRPVSRAALPVVTG